MNSGSSRLRQYAQTALLHAGLGVISASAWGEAVPLSTLME